LDAQIEHSQEGSLFRLGEWIRRRYRHCVAKRAESTKALRECEKSTALLREQWQLQVVAQTKPLPRTWAFVKLSNFSNNDIQDELKTAGSRR